MHIDIARRAVLVIGASLALAGAAAAAETEVYLGPGWTSALNGADAVSYRTLKEGAAPAMGVAQFTATYEGATWRFASAAHRDAFKADPAKYAPQYGGHCSFVLAEGKIAPGDPDVWSMRNGKVYLFVNKDIRAKWLADADATIAKADAHWPSALTQQ